MRSSVGGRDELAARVQQALMLPTKKQAGQIVDVVVDILAGEYWAGRDLAAYLRRMRKPGSAELVETSFPCVSRVVLNRSFVRPAMSFCSSHTTDEVSVYPVVTEPIMRRLPSRTYVLLSDILPSCSWVDHR